VSLGGVASAALVLACALLRRAHVQPDWIQPPYSVTDLIAALLWILAALYASLHLRDREPGAGWFAAAMVLFALFIGNNERHLPTAPTWAVADGAYGWFTVLRLGIVCLGVGLVDYVGLRGRARLLAIAGVVVPLVAVALLDAGVSLLQWQVSGHTLNLLAGVSFAVLTGVALWAWRRDPGAGYGYVAASLLTVPALITVGAIQQTPDAHLRYWAAIPILAVGLVLLTVSLMRRRRLLLDEVARRAAAERLLAEANASLEAKVQARTRELREMVAGLESFSRQVSHDLRGPLGGIGGLVQLASDALERGDRAGARRMLTPIGTQVRACSRLVDSLLLLARSGEATLDKVAVDLTRLTQDVASSLQVDATMSLQARKVRIDPLPTVQADETLLRAVLTNLIGNALKFTADRNDAQVRVSAQVEHGMVTVMVADNGVGFEPGAAAALFEPFARLHGAKYEGAGIGLTIVRRIVERHGGRVSATGEPGVGATFSFTLPA
jgi:signal transduction histidine kinase